MTIRGCAGKRLPSAAPASAPGFQRGEYFRKAVQPRRRYGENGKFQVVGEIVVIDIYIRVCDLLEICNRWNLFLIHKIPICLHTVLIICHSPFLAQQLHVTYDILEHIHEIPPVI